MNNIEPSEKIENVELTTHLVRLAIEGSRELRFVIL